MQLNLLRVILVVVVLAAVYLTSLLFERYEEPVHRGWSPAALRNPFLAAERMLETRDIPSQSTDRLNVLDDLTLGSTLIIRNANQVLNQRRAAELVQWMEAGGHVIVAAQYYDEDEPDVLLSHFDVYKHSVDHETGSNWENRQRERELAEVLEEALERSRERSANERLRHEAIQKGLDAAETIRRQESRSHAEQLASLSFTGIDYVLSAHFPGRGTLSHDSFYYDEDEEYEGYPLIYWAGNEESVAFLQLNVGAGLLTVMTDLNIWASSQIGLFDHAYLLQLLTSESDKVVFLYGAIVPNLMELTWTHFLELVIVVLFLLVAWMVYRLRRFGPVLASGSESRRSFQEHIRAVGQFLWRQKTPHPLMEAVRRDVWQALRRRHPGSESISEHEKLQQLAQAGGLDLDHTRALMQGPVPSDEVQFYQSIKLLQKIRKAL